MTQHLTREALIADLQKRKQRHDDDEALYGGSHSGIPFFTALDAAALHYLTATCATCRHCRETTENQYRVLCWHPLMGDANKGECGMVPFPFGCTLHEPMPLPDAPKEPTPA